MGANEHQPKAGGRAAPSEAGAEVLADPLSIRLILAASKGAIEQDLFICREAEWGDYPRFHKPPWRTHRDGGIVVAFQAIE